MSDPSRPIYLDHNATTPILPEVTEAMLPYLTEHFGNPSSGHAYGRSAKRAVERARDQVAGLIGCDRTGVVFTSGGTEANNLAILGSAGCVTTPGHVITSAVEHPATEQPCRRLESQGWRVDRMPVDSLGRVVPEQVIAALRPDTGLVTIMHANNETGSVQPLSELSPAAREAGALVHTDAAQSVGKIPVRMADLDVDMVSVAGHKLYGPKGVGALCLGSRARVAAVLLGANHEGGVRPGTENVASIVGLGVACSIATATMAAEAERVRAMRDRLWTQLSDAIPGMALNGHPEMRLPNTLNVRFPDVDGSRLLEAAPEIAASTGSACHHGQHRASDVLLAAGLDPELALGSVRLSLGRSTNEHAVDMAARALVRSWRELVEGQSDQ
jgi:cysteine desulfurase